MKDRGDVHANKCCYKDVPLDGPNFFGNTCQKDKATFMKKNIPIELS